ncbi:P-loop containing nucleoside triphosphate hydrolase protein [Trichoderma austrokoningii]
MEQSAANNQITNNQFSDGTRIHQGHNNTTFNLHLTHRPARAAIRLIPYPRNEDLVHRPDLVDKLNTLLPCPSTTSHSAALWGLGGSGKTQIALSYAYQRCADDSCSVLWVHADTEATFSKDYETIARKLQLNQSSLSNQDLLEAVRDGIEALSNWVLIVDNADDLKIFGVGQTAEETDSLLDYIPRASTGTVLWTARDAHIAGTLVGQGRGIEVARMRFDEAKQLLMTFGSLAPNKEDAEISSLIEELQSLPLAIMQAGTYMSRTSTTPKKYLALLAQSKKRWNLLKTDDTNRHRRLNVPNNVLETWTMSITRIRRESEMTYKTLHVIAYVSNENIPHEMITTTLGHIDKNLKNDADLLEPEAVKVITRLREFSFIGIRQAEDGSKSYEMHKLVQEAIRYGLSVRKPSIMVESHISTEKRHTQTHRRKIPQNSKGVTKRKPVEKSIEATSARDTENEKYFSTIALHVSSRLFLKSRLDTWKQREKYLAHALQVAKWADVNEKHIKTAQLLSKASWFLHERGRWREKEQVDNKVLKYRQEWLGDSHLDTIQAIANLAITYNEQGRYKESEIFMIQVLDKRREILRDKHPDTIDAMANLAITYNKQGRYNESESLQVQVLDCRQEILGARHPDTIRTMGNLAATYSKQGRYSESESLQVQVLDCRREILGARYLDIIRTMGNLATIYNEQGRCSKAEPLDIQVLDAFQEILGDRHPDTIRAMVNLSLTYHQQGRYDEAELLKVQALDMRREIFGDKHPDTIRSMRILANIWHAMGRREQAIALMQQAFEYSRSTLGANHP